jgi:hypothetical protein
MDVDGDRLDDVLAPLSKIASDEPLLVLSGFSGPDTGFNSMWLGSSDTLWSLDGVLFDADADGTCLSSNPFVQNQPKSKRRFSRSHG